MAKNVRLYIGQEQKYYETFVQAKSAAMPFVNNQVELRIEILEGIDLGESDFWAYNRNKGVWEPS